MNLFDLLIIYLACGAPFGVYYYFENRGASGRSLFKSFLVFLFWIPSAVRLLVRNRTPEKVSGNEFVKTSELDSEIEKLTLSFQKRFEKILIESGLNISVFDFRETFNRYAGLSTTLFDSQHLGGPAEFEIFLAANHPNPTISTRCLSRRNRRLLFFHQTRARQEFLCYLDKLSASDADKSILGALAVDFARFLNDEAALAELTRIPSGDQQNEASYSVLNPEKVLWTTEVRKPSHANRMSPQLTTMSRAATISRED